MMLFEDTDMQVVVAVRLEDDAKPGVLSSPVKHNRSYTCTLAMTMYTGP
jgi:hypothetical protein